MELYDVMRTTFAARSFKDEEVSDDLLSRILDNARFAPSGGNRQGWRVVVVRSSEVRKQLAGLIEPTFQKYVAQVMAGEAPFNTIHPSAVDDATVAQTQPDLTMVEQITSAPVILMVFVDLSVVASFDAELERVGVISGGSVYPFVWNILLAARNEGLGGTLTTFVGAKEQEVLDLFGVPEHYAFAAMLPIGRPVKQLTRLRRKPVESFTTLEQFDGEPLNSDAAGTGE